MRGSSRRGKRAHPAVAGFEFNLEANLLRLQAELQAQTYQPGGYHNFYIYEPKRRIDIAVISDNSLDE